MHLAQNNDTGASSTKSVQEIKEWYEQNHSTIENFKKAQDAVKKLRDVTKSSARSIQSVNKQTLRTYFSNLSANEDNMRKVSRYLYYRSNVYFRIVSWYASMWDLRCRKVTPKYTLIKNNDQKKFLKSLNDTLDVLELMNMQGNMTGVFQRVYVDDACYNIVFYDDTGMFFYNLEPEECRIDGRYMTGDFSFAIDMSKWRNNARQAVIEFLGEPLASMYKEYERTNEKWIHCPDEYAACFKFRNDIWDTCIPPLSGILLQLANLEDNIDQQAVADQLNIFKLVYLPMKVLSGSKEPDNFEIDPDTTLQYFKRILEEALPEYVAGAMVPGDELKTIDFSSSVDNDVNRVEKSIGQILSTAGGGAVLNSNAITSTAAFNAWLKSETEFAISTLMPQVNGFTNRFLSYHVSNPAKVDHFEISVYTKEEFRKAMLESCQYSYPNKIAYNTLLGVSEKETLAHLYMENDVLGLNKLMTFPLSSSYTQSGAGQVGQGRDQIPDDQLSGSGERSRNE